MTTITELFTKIDKSEVRLTPVAISTPKSRKLAHNVNAIFLEENNGVFTVALDRAKTQFNLWHIDMEPGLIITEGTKIYECQDITYTHYPKYPIMKIKFVKDESQNAERRRWEENLRSRYGLICN